MGTWCSQIGPDNNCWVFDNNTGSSTGSFVQYSINEYSGTLTIGMTWSVDMTAKTLTYKYMTMSLSDSDSDFPPEPLPNQVLHTFPFTIIGNTFNYQGIAFKRQ